MAGVLVTFTIVVPDNATVSFAAVMLEAAVVPGIATPPFAKCTLTATGGVTPVAFVATVL